MREMLFRRNLSPLGGERESGSITTTIALKDLDILDWLG